MGRELQTCCHFPTVTYPKISVPGYVCWLCDQGWVNTGYKVSQHAVLFRHVESLPHLRYLNLPRGGVTRTQQHQAVGRCASRPRSPSESFPRSPSNLLGLKHAWSGKATHCVRTPGLISTNLRQKLILCCFKERSTEHHLPREQSDSYTSFFSQHIP